jgi:hypothetical protein
MLCEICHGTRLIQTASQVQPCSECGGLGIIHGCDGLQAQPEAMAFNEAIADNPALTESVTLP